MNVNILFFGRIRAAVGKKSISVTIKGTECYVEELKKIVFNEFPNINQETFTIVVNKEVYQGNKKIKDGDEVAFLPPISGGSFTYLTKRKITNNFIKEFSSLGNENYGSTLTFIGRIRKDESANTPRRFIKKLEYTAYEEMAEKEIDKIVKSTMENFKVGKIFLKHRIGDVYLGDAAFVVVVYSAHRKEGMLAINNIIEEVKSKVPIWKKEVYGDGSENWQEGKLIG